MNTSCGAVSDRSRGHCAKELGGGEKSGVCGQRAVIEVLDPTSQVKEWTIDKWRSSWMTADGKGEKMEDC
jgi:hypothetical protein